MDHRLRSLDGAILFVATLLIACTSNWIISAQNLEENPIANLSTTWYNSFSSPMRGINLTRLQPILVRGSSTSSRPWFSCGFYCNNDNKQCLFAIFLSPNSSSIKHSKLVWSANRNNPVSEDATLKLSQDGNLVLSHANGTLVWETKTAGKSVSGLNMTELGNLVLFDRNNAVVWQSFDHPTDSLLPGQKLVSGQKLISNASSTDWSEGPYSLYLTNNKLAAYFNLKSNPVPQLYYESDTQIKISIDKARRAYITFENGYFGEYDVMSKALAIQYMTLEADGHLKVYEWRRGDWIEVSDLLTLFIGECGYPMVCGSYGICSSDQKQCSCLKSHFKEKSDRQPNLGCSLITSLSCDYSQFHSLEELKNITYSSVNTNTSIGETDLENCKKACLNTCSCKAIVFPYNQYDSSMGNCHLLSEVLSFKDSGEYNTTTAYVKIQNPPEKKQKFTGIIIGTGLGVLVGAILISRNILFSIWDENKSKEFEGGYFDQLPGTPARFSYEQLKAMTENFSIKLGEGGFGSVFEGTLRNGTKVAVKRLNKLDLVAKTFLAEVETIGNIHHVNLVRLIGFCVEKSKRLLVYEHMSNGSLNNWIFSRNNMVSLRWQSRKKIIIGIAKGLAYLHEGCRQKIFHLDVKPQNILLDDNFNAKLSDFGLSKLIDKDQSKVVTTIKGTPGYMAPEWLNSVITEKVDVYSFGVVVLEILCGRRNLDWCQPEEDMHLLSLLKRKAEEEQLADMVDKCSEDMQLHGTEVVKMLEIAAWCLQNEFERRPSMTVVVQVLEGLVNIEDNLDYNFTKQLVPRKMVALNTDGKEDGGAAATLLLPSVLSGPR